MRRYLLVLTVALLAGGVAGVAAGRYGTPAAARLARPVTPNRRRHR